jgi:hypothetical protein
VRSAPVVDLPERRVAHAEAGADVFRDEFNRRTVLHRVGLPQIFHSLDEQALPIHITRIRGTLPALIT